MGSVAALAALPDAEAEAVGKAHGVASKTLLDAVRAARAILEA